MSTLLAFVVVFGTIVFVHELGHFMTAKVFGVRVFEFSLGFPPRLVKVKWGDTRYSIGLIPLGGYVKMAGMDEPPEDVDAEDGLKQGQSFGDKPLLQRMIIIAAGPLMNFVLAALLFSCYFAFLAPWPPTVTVVFKHTPAATAGLMPGDQILAIAGERVDRRGEATALIQGNGGRETEILVKRGGKKVVLHARPVIDEQTGKGFLGVSLQERLPFIESLTTGAFVTVNRSYELIVGLGRMLLGQVQADIAGPVGIYQLVGESVAGGLIYIVLLAAILNINLGLLNFLPVPILDGGWLLFLVLEGIRGKPLEEEYRGLAQIIGLALLIMLMLFATYRDITRLGGS